MELYVDLFKAQLNRARLVQKPIQVRGKNGKIFTRRMWVNPWDASIGHGVRAIHSHSDYNQYENDHGGWLSDQGSKAIRDQLDGHSIHNLTDEQLEKYPLFVPETNHTRGSYSDDIDDGVAHNHIPHGATGYNRMPSHEDSNPANDPGDPGSHAITLTGTDGNKWTRTTYSNPRAIGTGHGVRVIRNMAELKAASNDNIFDHQDAHNRLYEQGFHSPIHVKAMLNETHPMYLPETYDSKYALHTRSRQFNGAHLPEDPADDWLYDDNAVDNDELVDELENESETFAMPDDWQSWSKQDFARYLEGLSGIDQLQFMTGVIRHPDVTPTDHNGLLHMASRRMSAGNLDLLKKVARQEARTRPRSLAEGELPNEVVFNMSMNEIKDHMESLTSPRARRNFYLQMEARWDGDQSMSTYLDSLHGMSHSTAEETEIERQRRKALHKLATTMPDDWHLMKPADFDGYMRDNIPVGSWGDFRDAVQREMDDADKGDDQWRKHTREVMEALNNSISSLRDNRSGNARPAYSKDERATQVMVEQRKAGEKPRKTQSLREKLQGIDFNNLPDHGTPLHELATHGSSMQPIEGHPDEGFIRQSLRNLNLHDMTSGGIEHVFRDPNGSYPSDPNGSFHSKLESLTLKGYNKEQGSAEWQMRLTLHNASGKYLGNVTRTIEHYDQKNPSEIHVHNALVSLFKDAQRSGISAHVYDRGEELWRHMAGPHRAVNLSIYANISVGMYTWATKEKGFDFDSDYERHNAQSRLMDFFNLNGMDGDSILEQNGYHSIDELNHAWQFSELRDGYTYDLTPHSLKDVAGDAHLGKAFMLTHLGNWSGTKMLNDHVQKKEHELNQAVLDYNHQVGTPEHYDDDDEYLDDDDDHLSYTVDDPRSNSWELQYRPSTGDASRSDSTAIIPSTLSVGNMRRWRNSLERMQHPDTGRTLTPHDHARLAQTYDSLLSRWRGDSNE